MQPTDRPNWIRWHKLPPALVSAILDNHQTVYLALHAYDNSLAILTVPTAERIRLRPKATTRFKTRAVIMTIVTAAPSCPTRGQTTQKNRASSQR